MHDFMFEAEPDCTFDGWRELTAIVKRAQTFADTVAEPEKVVESWP
jgi:hypothetical protein